MKSAEHSTDSTFPALVLASGSPRRRELLEKLGYRFVVRPVDIDEAPHPGELPQPYVDRLARSKAQAKAEAGELLLAADTVVAIDDVLLGKPHDDHHARAMLKRLAGRWHDVLTGVAVYAPSSRHLATHVESTRVRFTSMSAAEVDWYVATGEPADKAGAYAIQGVGALFVDEIEGNYSNVVGLPIPATHRLLRAAGLDRLSRRI